MNTLTIIDLIKRYLYNTRRSMATCLLVICSLTSLVAWAGQAEDLAKMQQELNAQVMEKPFSVADEAKIDQYIKDAMAKDLKPEASAAPKGWKPGWTCANIYSYGWNTYRNCRYYRRYYGYYW